MLKDCMIDKIENENNYNTNILHANNFSIDNVIDTVRKITIEQ